VRRLVVLLTLGIGLLAIGACAGDDDAVVETTSPEPPPPSTTTTTTPPTTAEPAGSTTAPPTGVTVAEADGWRLVVTEPTTGATVGRTTQLCIETSGPGREPVVMFDVTLLQPGSSSGSTPVRIDGRVGRGPVVVALPSVPAGRYDLSVQLVADGDQVTDVAVTIPVTLSDNVPAGTACE
jgi:hypothetical protein